MTRAALPELIAFQAIQELLEDYFDGVYFGDLTRLQRVFHSQAQYICAAPGDYQQLTMPEYWDRVSGRQSPHQAGQARRDRIVGIELAGPCAALARVNCAIGNRYFTDLLSLARIGDEWRIVAKLFHYQLTEGPQGISAAIE